MKTSNKMRATVLLGLMLGMTTGVYAAKAPDVTATSASEFLNFGNGQGVAVVSGEGSVAYGDSTIDCSTLPNSMTYVTTEAVTNIGAFGIGAFDRTGDDAVSVSFDGKVLNINPALASPLGRSWDTTTKNGIYAGGIGGMATVNIKATELNITATTPSMTDPLSGQGQWATILHANAGIESGVGYGNKGGTINIDLQGGDINIKNMQAGIGAHGDDSTITVTNAKDINITSDTAKTGAVLVSNDTWEGVFNNVGIGSTGGKVDVSGSGDLTIENYGFGIAQRSPEGKAVKVNVGGDIVLKGTNTVGQYDPLGGTSFNAASVGIYANGTINSATAIDNGTIVDITSGEAISVEGYELALVSLNNGADVKVEAKGDITLKSVGRYGIVSWANAYAPANRKGGNIELTSEDGKIYIEGSQYGIWHQGGNGGMGAGDIVIYGDAEIIGDYYGISSMNTGGKGKLVFNGDTKITADTGLLIYSGLESLEFNDDLRIDASDGTQYNIGIEFANYHDRMQILGDLNIDSAGTGLMIRYNADFTNRFQGAVTINAPTAIHVNEGSVDLTFSESKQNIINGNIQAEHYSNINLTGNNLHITGDVTSFGATEAITLEGLFLEIQGYSNMDDYLSDCGYDTMDDLLSDCGYDSLEAMAIDYGVDTSKVGQVPRGTICFDMGAGSKLQGHSITTGAGIVNLALSAGAEWQVTGDSSITSLALNGGVVDLLADGKQTLNIDTLSGGKGLFKMRLDADNEGNSDLVNVTTTAGAAPLLLGARPDSDADSGYLVQFEDLKDTVAAMNAAGKTRSLFATTNVAALRFASRAVEDTGIYDYNYDVEREDNGNSYDWYLTNEGTRSVSSIGKFVQQAAKAGYANIAGLDTYAARANALRSQEGGEGLWAQVDRSKLASDGSYAATVNRYRLGYDNTTKHGEAVTRTGVAISYGDGKTTLDGLLSRGDTESKTVELYNTRLYNNGAYRDLVIGYGSYDGEYDLTGSKTGNLFAADINNKAFKASVEYGKKNLTGGWFVEPQVQLQYARVLDSDYRIGDTSVATDAMDSFLARAGLRIGKDLGKSGSLYVKADVLHEFLGDQNLMATDDTGIMATTINNDGTWCNIGVGTAVALGRAALQLDAVKSFGNDMSDSWKLSANLQWSF